MFNKLTENNSFRRNGICNGTAEPIKDAISKIILVSNNICYGPRPAPDEEVQQRLTISSDGKVYISRYRHGNGRKFERTATERKRLGTEQVSHIIGQVYEHVVLDCLSVDATDVGRWRLSILYEDGTVGKYEGSLVPDSERRLMRLSDAIRELLACPDLFAFDGLAGFEPLDLLVLDYRRITNIIPDETTYNGAKAFVWDYSERLRIDRKSQTIKMFRRIGAHCTITNRYYIEDGVSDLLDDLSLHVLEPDDLPPENYVNNPNESVSYKLTLTYRKSSKMILTGKYDRDGLPASWGELMEAISSFIAFYGLGEILSPAMYKARRRRVDDLMFLDVVFSAYGNEYCYLSDDESIRVGDRVEVPVGDENRTSIVTVVKVSWLPKKSAPIPFERIKTIIRKVHDKQARDWL